MAKTLKLLITSKKNTTNDGKRSFTTYTTKMNLPIVTFDENGERHISEPKVVYVDVKFSKDCQTKASAIKRGYITAIATDINAPYRYEVKTDNEGKKIYPMVWVKNFIKYDESLKTPDQSSFVCDEESTSATEIEETTGE